MIYFVLIILGISLFFTGYVWLVINGFKKHFIWGILCIFLFPFNFIFLGRYPEKSWRQFILMILGVFLGTLSNRYNADQKMLDEKIFSEEIKFPKGIKESK